MTAGHNALRGSGPGQQHAFDDAMALGGAEFPGFSLLLTSNRERALEIGLRFRRIRLRGLQCNFAGHAMNFGFAPFFLGCFHCCHRFANAAPSLLELPKL
jgi:hypothetical protein